MLALPTRFGIRPEKIVSALYEALLGRRPDKAGLIHHLQLVKAGVPLAQIIRSFVDCTEFKLKDAGVVTLGALDALPANPIDLNLAEQERGFLWDHIGKVWSKLGTDDPFWSVLSSDEFRLSNMSENDRIDRFYESGRFDIERAAKYLARHGRALPEHGLCVDYGCGLGRTTLWLARRCKRVIAVDVSEAHLGIARENLSARGVTNVDFCLVRNRSDLKLVRGADFFHSILVLQHNPPPIIGDILSTALRGLNPDGSAFFQVPTYATGYSWEYGCYITDTVPRANMEMHVLPQSVIFDLAAEAGCRLLEVEPDHCTGLPHWISNTFLFRKLGVISGEAGAIPKPDSRPG